MRRLAVAELVLLAAAACALAVVILAASLVLLCRWRSSGGSGKRSAPPELPVSEQPRPRVADDNPTSEKKRRGRNALRRVLCLLLRSRRRARVEPAGSPQGEQEQVAAEDDDVGTWRERLFGHGTSRALYTIEEEEEEEEETWDGESVRETETPFYTPAASPSRL